MAEEEEDTDLAKLCFMVGPIGSEDSPQRIGADWPLEMIIQILTSDLPCSSQEILTA
jgi:hypothetical protein